MGEIKIKLPEDLTEEQKKKGITVTEEQRKKLMSFSCPGDIEPRSSGCMLILIIPLIISITMVCLINFK